MEKTKRNANSKDTTNNNVCGFLQVRCAMEAHTVPYAEELLAWWAKGRGTVSRSNSTLPRSESTRSGPFVD